MVYSRPLKQHQRAADLRRPERLRLPERCLGATAHDAYWYGLNQYLFYKVSDCMTYGIRAEWFRDQDGSRVGGFLGTTARRRRPAVCRRLASATPAASTKSRWVPTGSTAPTRSFRPYVRFDWFSGTSPAANLHPFDDGIGNSQTLLGFDVVTLY